MAKFDAATAVEEMEYDFTRYGGSEGVIPEPTTGAVNSFFAGMRVLLKEAKGSTANAELDENMNAEEMSEALDGMDDQMAKAAEFQERSAALLGDLCSGTPSAEDINKLPLRVMREFTKWLVQQINPKDQQGATVTTIPAPQDRKPPASRGSRKGRR